MNDFDVFIIPFAIIGMLVIGIAVILLLWVIGEKIIDWFKVYNKNTYLNKELKKTKRELSKLRNEFNIIHESNLSPLQMRIAFRKIEHILKAPLDSNPKYGMSWDRKQNEIYRIIKQVYKNE